MELRFAHLADYAGAQQGQKLTIVGIFDTVFDQARARPIPFPQFYLVAQFQAHITEGTTHNVAVLLVDADGHRLAEANCELKFGTGGPGRPLTANLVIGFGPGTIRVPGLGDYEFRFQIDGRDVGFLRVSVQPPQPQP